MGFNRTLLKTSTAAAALIAFATPVPAFAQAQNWQFDLPAQSLEKSLRAIARQTRQQVTFEEGAVRGKTAPAVKGNFTADQALQTALAGSGLEASTGRSGLFIIRPQGELGNVQSAANEAAASNGEEVAQNEKGIAEILVVGSKSQNVDIRRTEDDPQPYVIFNSEDIEKSQAANLEDFLRTRLPMNAQAAPDSRALTTASDTSNGASRVDLRGLGAAQTLILVDGRRAPRILGSASIFGSSNTIGDIFTQADINGIPLSAIERIEVLPSTAGGIYGGSAVGGVINIVRKRDYKGLTVQGRFDGTFRGGGEAFRIDVLGGTSFNDGRTQVTFNGSYSKTKALHADGNDLWRRARDRFLRNNAASSLAGYVPNIAAVGALTPVPQGTDGALCFGPGGTSPCFLNIIPNLILDNGTPLNSTITSVPIGYAGPGAAGANDGGAKLVGNAGSLNSDLSNDVIGRLAVLQSAPTVASLDVTLRQEIGDRLEAFVEIWGSRNDGRSYTGGIPIPISITGSAPNNPFQQTVNVNLPTPGIASPVDTKIRSLGVQSGLIAKLGKRWTATAEYSWNRAKTNASFTEPTFDFTALRNALSNDPTMNPFRDVNLYPMDLTPFLNEGPNVVTGNRVTKQRIASLRASGPIIELPGGPLNLTALMERRDEKAPERVSTSGSIQTINTARSQAVNSAYVELRIPVVGEANARPLIRSLELQGSIRHDAYRTHSISPASFDSTTSPQTTQEKNRVTSTDITLAARWQPAQDITFRASYGTGFLPPNIGQIVPNAPTPPSPIVSRAFVDPQRGLTPVPPHITYSGGSPDLNPETSKSISVGTIITPRFLPGFRLSADYTRIKRRGQITSPPRDIAFLEQYFPGRVVRSTDPSTFGPYAVGPIESVDLSFVNLARSELSAIDFQADYSVKIPKFGDLHFYAVATRNLTFRQQFTTESAIIESVDYSDGPLKWRGNAGVDWAFGPWNIGWNAQFYDSYRIYSSTIFDPSLTISAQGRDRIPHQIYNDLSLRYNFDEAGWRWASGIQVIAAIQNIFDKHPPVLATSVVRQTYSSYGDPRLRRYSFSIRKEF